MMNDGCIYVHKESKYNGAGFYYREKDNSLNRLTGDPEDEPKNFEPLIGFIEEDWELETFTHIQNFHYRMTGKLLQIKDLLF